MNCLLVYQCLLSDTHYDFIIVDNTEKWLTANCLSVQVSLMFHSSIVKLHRKVITKSYRHSVSLLNTLCIHKTRSLFFAKLSRCVRVWEHTTWCCRENRQYCKQLQWHNAHAGVKNSVQQATQLYHCHHFRSVQINSVASSDAHWVCDELQ